MPKTTAETADIYVLLDPDTRQIRYVGSTVDVLERRRLHWSQRGWRQTILAEWLRTLDAMPPHEIMQNVPVAQRWEAEAYWTALLRQVPGMDLLNKHDGTKHAGFSPSAETRARMSAAQRGKTGGGRPPHFDRTGMPHSDETRRKISEALRGKSRAGRNYKRGSDSPSAKLTVEQVEAIRADPRSTRVVAVDYGVSHMTIANIKSGKTWR